MELAARSTIAVTLTFLRIMFVIRLRVVLSSPTAFVSSAIWSANAGRFGCCWMRRIQMSRHSFLLNVWFTKRGVSSPNRALYASIGYSRRYDSPYAESRTDGPRDGSGVDRRQHAL